MKDWMAGWRQTRHATRNNHEQSGETGVPAASTGPTELTCAHEALDEKFYVAFRYNPQSEVNTDENNNTKTTRTVFERPVVEMDKQGNVLRVRSSSSVESNMQILDKDKPRAVGSLAISPPTVDIPEVPYVPDFSILGFNLGESLERSLKKRNAIIVS